MSVECGLVGLPNVGKSTIFNALTRAGAQMANYPFCTIEPNTGVVEVPDPRIEFISKTVGARQTIRAAMKFVDIAGLVKGASKGEGLGNQFLSHIREVDAIAHIVRCFEDPDVVHVEGGIDPRRDVEIINTELMLADLESLGKQLERIRKIAKQGDKDAKAQLAIGEPILAALEAGKPARVVTQALADEHEQKHARGFQLITAKPVLYVGNVADPTVGADDPHVKTLAALAAEEHAEVTWLCGKIEAEISELETAEERSEFLASLGVDGSGLDHVIEKAYRLLGLRTYFTAGEKETRAWTIHVGDKAPRAAGVIHSDFERGFIRAETYAYDDLKKYGSEAAVKEAGRLRSEGKEYVVQDGDIMHFRFNV